MVELYFVVAAVPIVPTSAVIVVHRVVMVVVVVFVIMVVLVMVQIVMMMVVMNVAVGQPWLLRRRTGLLHAETQGGRDWWWTRRKD